MCIRARVLPSVVLDIFRTRRLDPDARWPDRHAGAWSKRLVGRSGETKPRQHAASRCSPRHARALVPEHDELLGAPRCLGLDGFFDPVLGGETIANAMGVVSNTDALIIDPHRSSGQSWRKPGNGRVAHDVPVRRWSRASERHLVPGGQCDRAVMTRMRIASPTCAAHSPSSRTNARDAENGATKSPGVQIVGAAVAAEVTQDIAGPHLTRRSRETSMAAPLRTRAPCGHRGRLCAQRHADAG